MSNTEIVREVIIKSYKEGETFTAPGLALILAGKLTATQVGIALASIELQEGAPNIFKDGFVDQKGRRKMRVWKRTELPVYDLEPAAKPTTKAHPIPPEPKEPELNYAQIGKSIIERIKQLDALADEAVELRSVVKMLEERTVRFRNLDREQKNTISILNGRISKLNEGLRQAKLDKPKVGDKTFKMSEIARVT